MSASTVADTVEVSVRAVASGGDGVGELPDGRVVFVPRTAPGDRVLVHVEESRSSWARARLVEIVEGSDLRVEPPCALYDRCGGCQLQHLPYEEQLRWKRRFVVDALERIGKLSDVPEPEVVASPRVERYRTRMTFTLRRLRGGRVVAGLHAEENAAHVLDVDDECLLPRTEVLEAWTRLRRAWGSGARRLPDGGRLRLTLRSGGRGIELVVDGGQPGWRSGGLADDLPELSGVWHRPSGMGQSVLVAGESAPGGGDAFEQVNPEGAERLRAHALAVAGDPDTVVEAYCGSAALGRSLARAGATVVGIEKNASAAAAARLGAPNGLTVVEGAVEDHLAETLPADLLVVNPPRTGLADVVPAVIRAAPPERVVYVSCDAATLARDVERLGPGYDLSDLRCFDLFPHTAHVETVAVLDRKELAE